MKLTSLSLALGLLCISPSVSAKNFHAYEPDSIKKHLESLSSGDTLFIMPGKYRITPALVSRKSKDGPYAIVFDLSMNGENGKPIVIKGVLDDDGNRPIIDFSDVTFSDEHNPEGYRITGFLISGSHLEISNLECTGLKVTRTDHTQSENFRINGGSYNILENISCHDGMGIGFYINGESHNNLIINCDAFNNYDPVSDINKRTGEGSGGNNDGFGCHVKGGMDGNAFIGCRAWRNSDDGFDLINCYSPAEISYCIAIENGFDADGNNRADGNGVKAGGFGMKPRNVPLHNGVSPRHYIRSNVSVANKANGIYSNHHLGGIDFNENTSLLNGKSNYSMVNRKSPMIDGKVDVNGYDHSLKSNLSLSAGEKHAIWMNVEPAVSEIIQSTIPKYFDYSPLFAPRNADGTLSQETIAFIQSIRQGDNGADFSQYKEYLEKIYKNLLETP